MAANTNAINYTETVNAIINTTSIENLAQVLQTTAITPIDAKMAYEQANNGKLGNEAKALSAIFKHIAKLYENTDKLAGVSTIYNVIDARMVRKVKFTKKLAYNLQGSKALAQFVALTTSVKRDEHSRMCKSVNGNVFAQNRNTYTTQAINKKGNATSIRKPQANEAMQAIRNGNASSITDAPRTHKGKKLAQIAARLIGGMVNTSQLAIEYMPNSNEA